VSICGEYVDSIIFDNTNLHGDSLLDVFVGKIVQGNFCSAQLAVNAEIRCNGQCDGIATASSTGTAPFNYSWSTTPPQFSETATGLCAGTYTVTMTDANGCNATAFVTLTDPALLQATTSSTDVSCSGLCDGTAEASASGVQPFTYQWNTTPVQNNPIATALCPGSYTVTVTDSAGCTTTSTANIASPSAIQLTSAVTDASCIGCSDGAINVTVNGGTPNYQYSWSNSETTEDLQNIIAGSYEICVTDNNNCMECDTYTVLEPSTGITENSAGQLSLYPNPFSSTAILNFDNSSGQINTISVFSSIGKLVYQSETKDRQFTITSDNLESGLYYIEVWNSISGMKGTLPMMIRK
jgi:hypothetical protein